MNPKKKNNQSGFRIPEDYFDTLEERILQSVSASRNIPGQDGFEAPSGYMEQLDDRLFSAIREEEERNRGSVRDKKVPVFTLRRVVYSISAVAAIILIMLAIFPAILSPERSGDAYSISSIKPEEVEFYIENHMLPVYPENITDVFDTTDLNAISFSSIKEEELINYLEENMINYSEINLNQ
ncbi:hypothetical protein ED312_22105 [Sinomicrobium pectinilyticum]|uniref:Uncharacterized protein n=1 Tax=Sinomicrobium pectinilyticum TaxID=1084421 RepID=A0A3N0DFM6_SINP1|nr:hypothetical protein [Sinomicrobium pectinilyticum]RNL74435.1 hypothetical protein ED312_22105 [Sinomicrobium pectinilyticum]